MDVDWQADLDRWLARLSLPYGTRRGHALRMAISTA